MVCLLFLFQLGGILVFVAFWTYAVDIVNRGKNPPVLSRFVLREIPATICQHALAAFVHCKAILKHFALHSPMLYSVCGLSRPSTSLAVSSQLPAPA